MNKRACALLAARLLLGGAFLVAGLLKVSHPSDFASAIASFQIVSAPAIPLLAVSLPFLEIILGGMLLTGLRRRSGAFAAMILLMIYIDALVWALARGLPLECDCFGSSTGAPAALLRDGVLFAVAALLYRADCRPASRLPPEDGC